MANLVSYEVSPLRGGIAAGEPNRVTGWNDLSRMKGNFQVRFLEGGGLATARLYSAWPVDLLISCVVAASGTAPPGDAWGVESSVEPGVPFCSEFG